MKRTNTLLHTVFYMVAVVGMAFLTGGCSHEDTPSTPAVEQTQSFATNGTEWTYISLEDNRVVGTSRLYNDEEDAAWKARTDWDIAICGDRIRTNSGTSGNGQGGILTTDTPYDQLNVAPTTGYTTDSQQEE